MEATTAISLLTVALLSLRPLIDVLDGPIRLAVPGNAGHSQRVRWAAVMDHIAARIGAPRMELCAVDDTELDVFEQVLQRQLGDVLARVGDAIDEVVENELDRGISQVVDRALHASFERIFAQTEVASFDGCTVKAYTAGNRRRPAIVLASACGMPARLCESWMRFWSQEHFVVTWESRALFGDVAEFEKLGDDPVAQAGDLCAILDHYAIDRAHVMGICGGAIVGLAAAAEYADRVSSLSLWHGDYELGENVARTEHQRNLVALMTMAADGRESAQSLRDVFRQSALTGVRPDRAPFVLYPYANDELLFRYGRLNGSIMQTNVTNWLGRVLQPALVVTSEDDATAHPDGSRFVAANLTNAILHVEPQGDHLQVFDAQARLTRLAAEFIARVEDGHA